jgi:F0F1-type ATP synthase assembly protein I
MFNNKEKYNKHMISEYNFELEKEKELVFDNDNDNDNDNNDNNKKNSKLSFGEEFIVQLMSGLDIGIISVIHIIFGAAISYVICHICYYFVLALKYAFNMLWNLFDEGQELPQFLTVFTGCFIYVYIMCYKVDIDNQFDNYIYKLKSDIEKQEAKIAELENKIDQLEVELDNAYGDTVWETVSETSSCDNDKW